MQLQIASAADETRSTNGWFRILLAELIDALRMFAETWFAAAMQNRVTGFHVIAGGEVRRRQILPAVGTVPLLSRLHGKRLRSVGEAVPQNLARFELEGEPVFTRSERALSFSQTPATRPSLG